MHVLDFARFTPIPPEEKAAELGERGSAQGSKGGGPGVSTSTHKG
jgi:hypothetical protein